MCFFSICLILCKEHYGISVFSIGIIWNIKYSRPFNGIVLAVIGFITFVAIVFL